MGNQKIKVKYLQTGEVETITMDAWEKIKENGFEQDFQVIEEIQAPEEVTEALKAKKSTGQ